MAVIIEPRPHPEDPELGPTAILALIGPDLDLLRKRAGEDVEKVPVRDFFRVYRTPEGISLAGPALGAPAAVMAAEKLFSLGVRNLIFTGWAGALSPRASAGGIIRPTWAAVEEGVSAHYPTPSRPKADAGLMDHLATAAAGLDRELITGPVWTTDAVYRETRAKAEAYRTEGMLAVEMEASALLAVSAFRQRRTAGLLVVTDELHSGRWRPAFGSPLVEEARDAAADIALAAALNIQTGSGSLSGSAV